MAKNANQHFVPQYFFRRFNGGSNAINLLLTGSGAVVFNASIKHQCAAHKFYGSAELERTLGQLEITHSRALGTIADAGWRGDWSSLTPEIIGLIWEATLFQHSRTALEIEKSKDLPNSLAMPAFRNYLASAPGVKYRQEILQAIDKGEAKIVQTREAALIESISLAMESVLLISDLDFCVLRNHTDYPFIFSDSPVVFYNTMMRKVTSRGVLGLQTPGLQIFFPLEEQMLLMMYDEAAYKIRHNGSLDLTEQSDVSQLNALQLHHSLNAVYFGDPRAEEYIARLWQMHRPTIRRPTVQAKTIRNLIIDGELETNPVVMVQEQHLNTHLNLSFVQCEQIADRDYRFRHRNPELVAKHKKRIEEADKMTKRSSV